MTEERLVLADLLEKAGDGDFLRAVAEAVLQLLMESDVEGMIGAGRYERSGERTTWRNGYRDRTLDTRLGSLQLRIPKLRLCAEERTSAWRPFGTPCTRPRLCLQSAGRPAGGCRRHHPAKPQSVRTTGGLPDGGPYCQRTGSERLRLDPDRKGGCYRREAACAGC